MPMRLARHHSLSPECHASVSDSCPDPCHSGDFLRLRAPAWALSEGAAGVVAEVGDRLFEPGSAEAHQSPVPSARDDRGPLPSPA